MWTLYTNATLGKDCYSFTRQISCCCYMPISFHYLPISWQFLALVLFFCQYPSIICQYLASILFLFSNILAVSCTCLANSSSIFCFSFVLQTSANLLPIFYHYPVLALLSYSPCLANHLIFFSILLYYSLQSTVQFASLPPHTNSAGNAQRHVLSN